jgi:hypothetical protein
MLYCLSTGGQGKPTARLSLFYPPGRPLYASMNDLVPILVTLLIAVLGALTAWVERIRRDLADNTTISQEAKELSNGRLSEVLKRLDSSDRTIDVLRGRILEHDDRLAFLLSLHPELQHDLSQFTPRRNYHDLTVVPEPHEDIQS